MNSAQIQEELYQTMLEIAQNLNSSMKKKTTEGYSDAQVWTRMLNDTTAAYSQLSTIEYQRSIKKRQWQNNDFERYQHPQQAYQNLQQRLQPKQTNSFPMTPETEPEPQFTPTFTPTPKYIYPNANVYANENGYSVNADEYNPNSWE